MPDANHTPPDSPSDDDAGDEKLTFSGGIIRAAIVFEASIVLAAYFLGEIVERPPLDYVAWNVPDAAWGAIAALPLLILLIAAMQLPLAAIERLRDLCRDMLIPMFRDASWLQLVVVCALAGLGEEMLFRGVVQQGLADAIGEPYGPWVGAIVAGVAFGLAHAVTRAYAIAAGLVGLYLGGLLLVTGNMLVPIVAHAVYDLGAFVYLFSMERREQGTSAGEQSDDPDDNADADAVKSRDEVS